MLIKNINENEVYKMSVNRVTKEDLKNIISQLDNPIDKLLFVGLFKGLRKEDIANLKISDIDFENKKIHIDNRTIEIDREFEKLLKETIEQRTYYKMGDGDFFKPDYDFNMNSQYVYKVKPTKRNSNGLEPVTAIGVRKKMERMRAVLGEDVTTKDVIMSGAIEHLLSISPYWTVAGIEKELKAAGYKLSAYNVYNKLVEVAYQ